MKKLTFIILLVLSTVLFVHAQEVTSSAGGTKSTAEYQVSWTVGETVIETAFSENFSLTQGFHQPKLTVTTSEIFEDDLNIEVYPNPAQQFITIQSEELLENAEYVLFNLSGEKLSEGKIRSRITTLNLEDRASGSYILKLLGKNKHPLQIFKIVKK